MMIMYITRKKILAKYDIMANMKESNIQKNAEASQG